MFLYGIALLWIIFATLQDIKTREVANWLNFSLIIFALGFRIFYSLFGTDSQSFAFFYQGLIGLGIFYAIGNIFYYGRVFGGGDAKLMIALGAVLPLHETFTDNIKIYIIFFLIFLLAGSLYGVTYSLKLSFGRNYKKFKKELYKQISINKNFVTALSLIGIVLFFTGIVKSEIFVYIGLLVFAIPYSYVYAKAVDEVCMIKKIRASQLREGDWLYKDFKKGRCFIKADWEGLTKEQIRKINKVLGKNKFIKIKEGIPFVPVFLISFILLFFLTYHGNLEYLFNALFEI